MLVFAYVDLFSFFRPDFRADVEAGVINGFAVGQTFLLVTTAYVLLPTLMIFGGAVGEWGHYVLGSAIEVALLAAIEFYAWTWPRINRR